ncbi:MAG TPA: hypothetical protein PKC18_17475 [Lacipirellulaceae bacterium]|nr:hypothetical protein [Lacipirellulaceae bacterium]
MPKFELTILHFDSEDDSIGIIDAFEIGGASSTCVGGVDVGTANFPIELEPLPDRPEECDGNGLFR